MPIPPIRRVKVATATLIDTISWQVSRAGSALAYLCFFLATTAIALDLSNQLLDSVEKKYGTPARERLVQWQQMAKLARITPTDERKLALVNSFFNRVTFVSDWDHWGEEDYWATPIELLATNGGDCEDYSIAKYFTLRDAGIPEEKLRITYVKALRLNQAHMVLAYYPKPGAEPLILDNLVNDILPASQRSDLAPVYSFNGDGLWLSKQRGAGKRIGDAGKLDRWTDLKERFLLHVQ